MSSILAGAGDSTRGATLDGHCSMAFERAAARRPLAHELAFGVLYGVVLLSLLFAPGGPAWREITIWLALAATSGAVIAFTIARPTTLLWRVRLGVYLMLMNVAYFRVAHVVMAIYGELASRDTWLQAADTALFGRPLPLYVERWTHPLLSDVLSACYFLLFPYLVISVVRRLVAVRENAVEARRFFAGVFTVYAIGLLGYLLVPAAGAYLAMPDAFAAPLVGGWITRINESVVRHGSNQVDVFPSLHIAVSAFMLFFDQRFARWRYRAYLIPAVGLWISTVYLRFHYGVDVLAGFALAAFGLWIAFRRDTGDRPSTWSTSR
jgi:hypothetical protein